jgi:hypothetical protein
MQFFRVLQSEVDKIDNPELQQNAKQKLQFFKTRITEDKQKNQLQQFLTRGNQFLEKLQKPRRNRKLLRIAQERIVELQRKTQFFLQNSNKEKHISDEDRKKLEELDQRLTEAMEKLPIARETVPNIRHQRRNPGKETVTHQVDTSPK